MTCICHSCANYKQIYKTSIKDEWGGKPPPKPRRMKGCGLTKCQASNDCPHFFDHYESECCGDKTPSCTIKCQPVDAAPQRPEPGEGWPAGVIMSHPPTRCIAPAAQERPYNYLNDIRDPIAKAFYDACVATEKLGCSPEQTAAINAIEQCHELVALELNRLALREGKA